MKKEDNKLKRKELVRKVKGFFEDKIKKREK